MHERNHQLSVLHTTLASQDESLERVDGRCLKSRFLERDDMKTRSRRDIDDGVGLVLAQQVSIKVHLFALANPPSLLVLPERPSLCRPIKTTKIVSRGERGKWGKLVVTEI